MQFLYPALTWGFLLALIPIAIHLINMVRQRRVDWAAMEFLLQAYKKHRRWILFKQLLLLAMRVAAIALVVAMLAHFVTARQWTRFLGAKTTHHLVLLDDSFSMSDRDTSSAFDRAIQAVQDLAQSASQQPTLQRMTLLRFSRTQSNQSLPSAESSSPVSDSSQPESDALPTLRADIDSQIVDTRFSDELAELTAKLHVSETAADPGGAVATAARFINAHEDDQFVVYLISDFRQRNWGGAKELAARVNELIDTGAEIRMVRCVDDQHANLAITDLRPAEGTRAAGVPLFFDVTVKNFGNQEIKNVAISLECDTYRNDDSIGTESPFTTQILPAVTVESLPPAESATERFQVYFPTAGSHVVRAVLPPDAVAVDNFRASVVDVPEGIPTLIVDGDPEQRNARYLLAVFQPGERIQTGIRPTVHDIAFLRDATPESLAGFRSIFLLDIPRLDERARRNLNEYVRSGGGLAIFFGPETSLSAYNEWHGSDPAVLPVRLERIDRLGKNPTQGADLEISDHFLFRTLQGSSNPFLRSILVDQYVRTETAAGTESNSPPQVIAKVRSGYPFAVASRAGTGQTILVTSSLAPLWNNWATQPSFVVFLLELQSYLASRQARTTDFLVGGEPEISVSAEYYRPQGRLSLRTIDESSGDSTGNSKSAPVPNAENANMDDTATAVAPDPTARNRIAPISAEIPWSVDDSGGQSMYLVDWNDLANRKANWQRAGILTVNLQRTSGSTESRRFAINVVPEEGELLLATNQELGPDEIRSTVGGSTVRILRPADLRADDIQPGGFEWTEILLAIVCLILLLEQFWASVLSYHPSPAKRFA